MLGKVSRYFNRPQPKNSVFYLFLSELNHSKKVSFNSSFQKALQLELYLE